jgi:hypothetical protein
MWKILVAFIIFAAIALTLVFNMGDKVDMQGESGGHGESAGQHPAPATPPAATAPADTPAAAPAAQATDEKK